MTNNPDEIFPFFIATWIVLGISGLILFNKNRDLQFKKKWFPKFIILIGTLFTFFVWLMGATLEAFYLLIPGVILISFLNIRLTKFCSTCGKMMYNYFWFTKMKYCSKCGAELDNNEKNS